MSSMSQFFQRLSAKGLVLCACLVLIAIESFGCSSREERAQSYYAHGMTYLAKNDYVKARIELRNALQLNEDMVGAWRVLAQIDEHDRNWQALAGSLRRITELDPKDIDARMRLAKLLFVGRALDEALKMANSASEINPKNADALGLKASILLSLKDTDGAARTAQKALEIDSGNTSANFALAAEKFLKDDSGGALQTLANVTSAHQDDLGVISLKISIFDHLGNLPQVEALLHRLVTLHPNEPFFRTQLIRFYVAHKRKDDAVKELRTEIAANPSDSSAEFELVDLLNVIKGPAAARTELIARIAAGGRVLPYQIALAKFDIAQGNFTDGTKLLQKLISSSNLNDILTAKTALAEAYMGRNDVAAAQPLIADILRVDSRNITGLRLRAVIHLVRGQVDDAIADLRAALNDQPRSPELLATLALAYERNGSIDLADKAFFDATKASGFAQAFGLNYVAFLQRRGLTARAENVLVDLASRNPKNIAILSALAQAKLALKDWVGAHQVANSIRRLGGKSDIADQINGVAFSGERKINESIAALLSAYDANPGAVQPMAALVSVYLHSHQINKAEAFVQAVLQANSGNAEALVLMGSIQLAKNDPIQAMNSFEMAIKQQPKEIIGYRALADLYARQQKIGDALKIIRAGLQQRPDDFAGRLTLAGLLEANGDYDAAIVEYDSMLKDQPGSVIIANNLASLLLDHRTDKASLEQANALAMFLKNSQLPQFKDTLGWNHYRQGNYTAAIPFLEDAAGKLPNSPLVRYHLAMSYLAVGKDARASDQFKKAHDLAPNDADLEIKIDSALKNHAVREQHLNN